MAADRRKSDRTILAQLLQARKSREMTQEELANKSGLGQSQISQIEHQAINPQLSTIQDLARVLDLELMLIPRHLLSAVEGVLRGTAGSDRPLYDLSELEAEEPETERSVRPVEVGAAEAENARTQRSHAARKPAAGKRAATPRHDRRRGRSR
jgi:transcriptional regulator with XRE-family HTH domain